MKLMSKTLTQLLILPILNKRGSFRRFPTPPPKKKKNIYIYIYIHSTKKESGHFFISIYIIYYLNRWQVSYIIWKRNLSSIRIVASYDLGIHSMTDHNKVTKTRSQIKNCKIAQTQWEHFFNETFLMKGLTLLFIKLFLWFSTMFTV